MNCVLKTRLTFEYTLPKLHHTRQRRLPECEEGIKYIEDGVEEGCANACEGLDEFAERSCY